MTCDGQVLRLHGNAIATWDDSGALLISMAGWGSVTTRERLNGLLSKFNHIRLCQKDFGQYASLGGSVRPRAIDPAAWYKVQHGFLVEVPEPILG
jgi:hypothetical protein